MLSGRTLSRTAVALVGSAGIAVATATPAAASVTYQTIQLVDNTSMCIGVPGDSTSDRVNLTTVPCGTSASQSWVFTVDSSGTWGELRNTLTGKCMDIRDKSRDNGTAVQQYTCNGGSNQKFRFELASNAFLRNKNSNMCVSVFNSASPDYLVQWGCPIGYPSQRWQANLQ